MIYIVLHDEFGLHLRAVGNSEKRPDEGEIWREIRGRIGRECGGRGHLAHFPQVFAFQEGLPPEALPFAPAVCSSLWETEEEVTPEGQLVHDWWSSLWLRQLFNPQPILPPDSLLPAYCFGKPCPEIQNPLYVMLPQGVGFHSKRGF